MSGAVLAPVHDDGAADAIDRRLVAAVRRGDDRAFEALYARYHRRIHAYVVGMVKDHGRAEDVTQEVFVSALRRMRATERPIAFKPWIYEIAKNACIDAFRRSKRAEEVSYDADEGFSPSDHSRLVGSGPAPDAAFDAKHDLESLCGAFGGLSETHHEILVLRELEGLSYQEIGRRMGMSRPAVESTLFRARRRLSEEYDDIVSGARCLRIQGIIQTAAQSRLGLRDTRRLARHLAHCQPCRREALAAGLDRSLVARPPLRERVAAKVAGILPFPIFARLRRGADAAPPSGGGRTAGWAAHLPVLSDQLSGGWGKLAAGAALLVAGLGAGAGVRHVTHTPDRPAAASAHPAAVKASAPAAGGVATTRAPADTLARPARTTSTRRTVKQTHRTAKSRRGSTHLASGKGVSRAGAGTRPATGGSGGQASTAASGSGGTHPPAGGTPPVKLPAGGSNPVKQATDTTRSTAHQVTGVVEQTVQQTTGAVEQAAGGTPAAGTVDQAASTVNQAAGDVKQAVDETVDDATHAVDGLAGG